MIELVCGVTRLRHAQVKESGACGPLARLRGGQDSARYLITCAHVGAPAGFKFQTMVCEALDGQNWVPIGIVKEFSDQDDGVDAAVIEIDRSVAIMGTRVGDLGLPKGVTHLTGPGVRIQAACAMTKDVPKTLSLEGHAKDFDLPYIDSKGKKRLFRYSQHLTCRRFSQKGDSGSPILDWDNFYLGMLVGATKNPGGQTVIAPFQLVLDFFKTRKNLDLELVV